MTGPARRHLPFIQYLVIPVVLALSVASGLSTSAVAAETLQVGMAQVDITPPMGFPMAGYYHERLATGTIDPLWAKAVYFHNGETEAAWVACDLTGVSTDLSREIRKRVTQETGIPTENIAVSASHSHTAPDYYRALYQHLGPAEDLRTETDRQRAAYAGELIARTAQAIINAKKAAHPAQLKSGSVQQETQVSYCRRFVMNDGTVKTWVGLKHPDAIRSAAAIDPQIGLIEVLNADGSSPTGLISNFALHLDTTGGMLWSADYPYAIEQSVQGALGKNVISLFGTGCCGDINHADPTGQVRRKSTEIGSLLGKTIVAAVPELTPVSNTRLQVRTRAVPLALEEVSPAEVEHSLQLIKTVNAGQKIDFFDHVLAYKRLVLDQLTHKTPHPESGGLVSLGISRSLQGVGEALPTEVIVMTIGTDVALVFLPGEIFNELGRSIKQASPFRTTLVVELTNSVESIYIPNRHGYVGGGYEPTNSLVQPGSGEKLVEAAVSLLQESAKELVREAKAAQ